jgi:hypothetical protein
VVCKAALTRRPERAKPLDDERLRIFLFSKDSAFDKRAPEIKKIATSVGHECSPIHPVTHWEPVFSEAVPPPALDRLAANHLHDALDDGTSSTGSTL